MTGLERRIAELAASDLESWALELPLGSETRRDLQQSARAYRFSARVGVAALRAVPETGAREDGATDTGAAWAGGDRALDGPRLAEVPREISPPLEREA